MVGDHTDNGPSCCRKRLRNLRQVLMKDNSKEERSAGNAKQRLAAFLTPQERFGLAQAMLSDTVRAVRGVL